MQKKDIKKDSSDESGFFPVT